MANLRVINGFQKLIDAWKLMWANEQDINNELIAHKNTDSTVHPGSKISLDPTGKTKITAEKLQQAVDQIENEIKQFIGVNANAEVGDAHISGVTGETYLDLRTRMDNTDSQLAASVQNKNTVTLQLGNELLTGTGWILPADWSGNFSAGFTHAAGSTGQLVYPLNSISGHKYLVQLQTINDTPSEGVFGSFTVQIGNSNQVETYKGGSGTITYQLGIESIGGGNLIITPASTFAGTIINISVKEITSNGLESINITVDNCMASNASVTTAFWNTSSGVNALASLQNGTRNVVHGYNAFPNLKDGSRNVGIGTFVGKSLVFGAHIVAAGSDALFSATSATDVVTLGKGSMYNVKSANNTVALGSFALKGLVDGDMQNTVGVGSMSGYYNNDDDNTFIGYKAGYFHESGSRNVFIGSNSGNNADGSYTHGTGSDNVVIAGKMVTYDASHYITISDFIRGGVYNNQLAIGTMAVTRFSKNANTTILQVNTTSGGTELELVSNTNTDGILIGEMNFINSANSNIDANHRPWVATVSSKSKVTNNNAGQDSGANLLFYVKPAGAPPAMKVQITANGQMGIGRAEDSVSAQLHFASQNTAAGTAPIKFVSGSLMTTPENGALEYYAGKLYLTDDSGVRHQLSFVS